MTRHLIIRCYSEIRTVRVVRETADCFYTDYGKARFRRNDSDIIAVCDDEAAAKALRRRIDPVEAAYRQAQSDISARASADTLAARQVRDMMLKEIIDDYSA